MPKRRQPRPETTAPDLFRRLRPGAQERIVALMQLILSTNGPTDGTHNIGKPVITIDADTRPGA